MRYIDKIKEKPQVQHTLKERVKSAPKELIRRGLDDGTERLRGQLRDVAQHGQRDDFGGDQLGDAEVSGVKQAEQLAERLLRKRKKAQNIPRTQARTDTLAVTIRQEQQGQEMTVFCLQRTAFTGRKRELRSGRRVRAETAHSRSPHSKRLKKETSRPRTPI